MAYSREVQRSMNQLALTNPKPGDYWNEMLVSIALVIKVTKRHVFVVRKTIDDEVQPKQYYHYDFSKVEKLRKADFRRSLCYMNLPNQTHCDVVRDSPRLMGVPQEHTWRYYKGPRRQRMRRALDFLIIGLAKRLGYTAYRAR